MCTTRIFLYYTHGWICGIDVGKYVDICQKLLIDHPHVILEVWRVNSNKNLTFTNLSRISQLKIPGQLFLYSSILRSTSGVATRGLLPPITPGLMLPVSWYRFKIFETHPWDTLSCLDITHGLTPDAANSTIFSRMWFGKGRPFMNTPPSWFTLPWPVRKFLKLLNLINKYRAGYLYT